jgi:hypothetical protein
MVPVNQNLYLQPSLDRLRVAVLEQNRPGSVEGLLAHHVLKDNPRINIDWQVACTPAWMDTEFRPTILDHVAALGYYLWAHPTSRFTPQLLDGLSRVRGVTRVSEITVLRANNRYCEMRLVLETLK